MNLLLLQTSLYTAYNFLPKFLYKSFSRVANCYFLMICVLQTFHAVSITHGKPSTVVPLMFILFVAAVKEANEDISRHKADKEENSTVTHVVASMGTVHPDPVDTRWEVSFPETPAEPDLPTSELPRNFHFPLRSPPSLTRTHRHTHTHTLYLSLSWLAAGCLRWRHNRSQKSRGYSSRPGTS